MSDTVKMVADEANIRELIAGMAKGDRIEARFPDPLCVDRLGSIRKLKIMEVDRYDVTLGRVTFVCDGDEVIALLKEITDGHDVVARYIPF